MNESVPLPTPEFNQSLRVAGTRDRLTGNAGAGLPCEILDKTRVIDTLTTGISDLAGSGPSQ